MNVIKIGLFLVFCDFVAFTAWVAYTGGSLGEVVAQFGASPWAMQVAVDLVIALSIVSVWIWNDAKARGATPLPWVIATLFTGSIAPLAYLLLRPSPVPAPLAREGLART